MLKELFLGQQHSYSNDVINILRLIRSENIGPRTFFTLLKTFGSVENALENISEFSLRGGCVRPIKAYSKHDVEKEFTLLEKHRAKIISYKDRLYSSLLLQIFDFPPIITYKGNIELLNHPQNIAIIGSRAASINGKNLATKFSRSLIEQGYIITSGLARGIDTSAHCVDPSKTIAVVAGGIDNIYPLENKKLFDAIAAEGLLISELRIGTKPLAQHFPQRNRLISGLSLGVVVIEAGLNSGSLITARTAMEQGREVFTIPGFPGDPRYQGNNKLIKEGACVVETIQDITSNLIDYKKLQKSFEFEEEAINSNKFKVAANNYVISDKMRKSVLSLLSSIPVEFEQLLVESQLTLPIVQTIILELELAGKVIRLPGNRLIRIY